MNACVDVWGLVGADYYTWLLESVFSRGGTVVQSAEFFLAFVVEDGCAVVWFAAGDMRKILRFAHANAGLFGFDRVGWSREWAGKHKDLRVYRLERLKHE